MGKNNGVVNLFCCLKREANRVQEWRYKLLLLIDGKESPRNVLHVEEMLPVKRKGERGRGMLIDLSALFLLPSKCSADLLRGKEFPYQSGRKRNSKAAVWQMCF